MAVKKGTSKTEYSKEAKAEIFKKVCDVYAASNSTLTNCCEALGISERLFRYWMDGNVDFSELYKKAKERSTEIYWDRLREKAQTGLERLVSGETYTETRNEVMVGEKGTTTKNVDAEVIVMPNPTSVIFALKGEYPERFTDRHQHSAEVSTTLKLDTLTLDEKLKMIEILNKANGA
jgi:hypothetical protein